MSRPWPTVSGSLGLPKVARHFPPKKQKWFFIVGSPVMLKMVHFSVAPLKPWRMWRCRAILGRLFSKMRRVLRLSKWEYNYPNYYSCYYVIIIINQSEITPEANPWAVRWMEDLEALVPYDERGVVQRMGKDVRALFLDRELAADFVAIDVLVLRLQSLSTQVPPWDFREEVSRPMEVSQEGVPQWRCCFDDRCEAKFESFKALATHVLRHHRQMETVSRLVLTNQCPVCLAVYGDRTAAHRHLLSSLRRGSCRDRSRYLGQVHIPQSLCCPVCSAEPGNWSELQLHLAEHLSSLLNGPRNAVMGETQAGRGSARAGPTSGETGGGRRGQRARGSSTLGGRAGYSVSGQRGRIERPDRYSVQDIPGPKLGKRGRSNGRGRSALPRLRWRNQEQARSGASRRSRAARSPFSTRVGSVPAQLGRDEGVHQCSWQRTFGTAEQSRAGKSRARKGGPASCSAWTRPLSPLEGALEAALRLQKGVRKYGPAPRGPLEREAARLLTQMRGKWSAWQAEWNTAIVWLSSCVGECWSRRWRTPS